MFNDESTFCLFGNHKYVITVKVFWRRISSRSPWTWGWSIFIKDGPVYVTKYICMSQTCVVQLARLLFQHQFCFEMTVNHVIVPNWSTTGSSRTISGRWPCPPNLWIWIRLRISVLIIKDGPVYVTKYICMSQTCVVTLARLLSQHQFCSKMTVNHGIVPNWSTTGSARTISGRWPCPPKLWIGIRLRKSVLR